MNTRTAAPFVTALLLAAASARAQDKPPAPPPQPPAKAPSAAPEQSEIPPKPGSADDINYELDIARPRPAGLLPNGPVSILDPHIDRQVLIVEHQHRVCRSPLKHPMGERSRPLAMHAGNVPGAWPLGQPGQQFVRRRLAGRKTERPFRLRQLRTG